MEKTITISAKDTQAELCTLTHCDIGGCKILTPIGQHPRSICEDCAQGLSEILSRGEADD